MWMEIAKSKGVFYNIGKDKKLNKISEKTIERPCEATHPPSHKNRTCTTIPAQTAFHPLLPPDQPAWASGAWGCRLGFD